eukprot:gene5059-6160_t
MPELQCWRELAKLCEGWGLAQGDIMMERVIELASLLSGRGRYCTLLDEDCVIQGRIIEDTLTLTDLIGERALWFTSGVKLQ